MARVNDWPVCFIDQIQAPPDGREHPQRQTIHLEDAQCIQVVLIPLHDGAAGHAGIFDRHNLAQRQVGQNHAADMLRQMAGKAQDLARRDGSTAGRGGLRVEARLGQAEEQLVALGGMTDRIGQGVDPVERQAQCLADVPHGRTRPIGDQFGRHAGPIAAVLLVDILNHFFPALMLEVDVDVRGFVPILGDEPLEQDIDPIRVNGRDPQAITDGRVGRRAASLAEDVPGRGQSGPGPRRSGNRPRNSARR